MYCTCALIMSLKALNALANVTIEKNKLLGLLKQGYFYTRSLVYCSSKRYIMEYLLALNGIKSIRMVSQFSLTFL